MNDTAQRIEAIADPANFERLVLAVLRRANPAYKGLIHTGINAFGKTVKSPVDAIAARADSDGLQYIIVHCTTSLREDLPKKWLHENRSVDGRNKTTPDGDVIKTIRWAVAARLGGLNCKINLVLATNRIPEQNLIRETSAILSCAGINFDYWDQSRLSDFLDNEPEGQWLRQQYLDITQQRVSIDLLRELSHRSLEHYASIFAIDRDTLVLRDSAATLLQRTHEQKITYLVADAGQGKSAACYLLMEEIYTSGGFSFWIWPDLLMRHMEIPAALDAVLRSYHPQIELDAGLKAMQMLGDGLVLVVDDVARASSTQICLDVLAAHGRRSSSSVNRGDCRIVCPVQTQALVEVDYIFRAYMAEKRFILPLFTESEAIDLLRRRTAESGVRLTYEECAGLVRSLGNDPLLIGLWGHATDLLPSTSQGRSALQVIDSYVETAFRKVKRAFSPGLYREALNACAIAMLSHKNLNPGYVDLCAWFLNKPELAEAISLMAEHRDVVLWGELDGPARLAFRHDRVRNVILARAVVRLFQQNALPKHVVEDPFFADVIGTALVMAGRGVEPCDVIDRNPLAVFYAFKHAVAEGKPTVAIVAAISQWMDSCANLAGYRAEAIQRILLEIDHPEAFRVALGVKDFSVMSRYVGCRNGDVQSAIIVLARLPPYVLGEVERDWVIEHAVTRHAQTMIPQVCDMLVEPVPPDWEEAEGFDCGAGALFLAGYLGDSQLVAPLTAAWETWPKNISRLLGFLWAGVMTADPHHTICQRVISFLASEGGIQFRQHGGWLWVFEQLLNRSSSFSDVAGLIRDWPLVESWYSARKESDKKEVRRLRGEKADHLSEVTGADLRKTPESDWIYDLNDEFSGAPHTFYWQVDDWWRELAAEGMTSSEAVEMVVRWMNRKRSVNAYRVAGIFVARVGCRSDLERLVVDWLPKEVAELASDFLQDVCFELQRRTLD